MNAVIDALKFRHACKKFDPDKMIPDKKLGIILEAACLSPAHLEWKRGNFLVLESKGIRERPSASLLGSGPRSPMPAM